MRPFAQTASEEETSSFCVSQKTMLVCYPEGTRVGLVFSDIWGDVFVSDRQDKSISRASVLSWMSAVRRWRASRRTLEAAQQSNEAENQSLGEAISQSLQRIGPSPQVLEGLVHVPLQISLHSLDELHLLLQLLLHGVGDQLVSSTSVSQRQALLTDLQGDSGGGQRLLRLLLGLSRQVDDFNQRSDMHRDFSILPEQLLTAFFSEMILIFHAKFVW